MLHSQATAIASGTRAASCLEQLRHMSRGHRRGGAIPPGRNLPPFRPGQDLHHAQRGGTCIAQSGDEIRSGGMHQRAYRLRIDRSDRINDDGEPGSVSDMT